MTESFAAERLTIKSRSVKRLWDYVEELDAFIQSQLSEIDGMETQPSEFRISADGGSRSEKPSLDAVHAVIEEQRWKPVRVDRTYAVNPVGAARGLPWHDHLNVSLQVNFSFNRGVVVKIEGQDRVRVDGLRARLAKEVPHLKRKLGGGPLNGLWRFCREHAPAFIVQFFAAVFAGFVGGGTRG